MKGFGDFDIEDIKERVTELCSEKNLPLREVYVSADYREEIYQVEIELFKEYESLEEQLREEIEVEEALKDRYGDSISVNIVCVDED